MEFKHIEYFIETCRHKSISRAAAHLYISQQALSRCISNLETELGCTLFTRTAKGISLTEEGQFLYNQFAPLITSFYDTCTLVSEHMDNQPRKLSFACAPLIFRVLNPKLLLDFRKQYPKISIDLIELSDTECDLYVEKDSRHFGMLAIPENRHGERLNYLPIRTYPLFLYVHKDNPLAEQTTVNFGMLKNEPFLVMDKKSYYRKTIASYTKKYGYRPKPIFESADIDQLLRLVNLGQGITIAPAQFYNKTLYENIVLRPFDDDTITHCIAFIFQDFNRLSATAKKFITFLQENAELEG